MQKQVCTKCCFCRLPFYKLSTLYLIFILFYFRSYLGTTVHWIDPEALKRQQRVLAYQRLLGRHTYDHLAKTIHDIHFIFGITNNVVSTTTDNGTNFVKAFSVFGEPDEDWVLVEDPPQVEPDDEGESDDHVEVDDVAAILANGEETLYELPKHLRYTAHTLNLVATTDAEKAFSDNNYKANHSAFGKALSLWNKQHRSSQASDIMSQEVGKLLVEPNATR
ncbi:uncharacterized protein LOC121862388 [Homarus americanus]|uniref:uncharacterized protein LOC121862388 n=1 Tax=Homarus americanus TaxID=6706 RepID=UPI001C480A7E|nr:uncharacterized protein LOC121862388 [Homarus americanus]XP_042216588.1 uncharacterized protein LOC121862388 [Homarus americanus]